MLEVFEKAPIFVWPLLAMLIWGGLKARKTSWVPLYVLALIPAIFVTWFCYSIYMRYGLDVGIWGGWIVSEGVGLCLGIALMRRLNLKFDKNRVELPGSWIPLILSMSIFSMRFALGMMYAMHPEMAGSWPVLALEYGSAVISGVFVGRIAGCLKRRSNLIEKG